MITKYNIVRTDSHISRTAIIMIALLWMLLGMTTMHYVFMGYRVCDTSADLIRGTAKQIYSMVRRRL